MTGVLLVHSDGSGGAVNDGTAGEQDVLHPRCQGSLQQVEGAEEVLLDLAAFVPKPQAR